MNTDVMLTVGTIMVSIITAVMLGLIPWAYRVHGRLTKIEVHLDYLQKHGPVEVMQRLALIEGLVQDHEKKA